MTVKRSVMESVKEYTFSFSLRVCLALEVAPVMGSAFKYRLQRSLLLMKLRAFTVTGSEGVCDEVCIQLQALTKSDFSKASGLY